MTTEKENDFDCNEHALLAIRDTMELLSGKWKIQIVGILLKVGRMRFMDLRRVVGKISPKMLSKELQELEQNKILVRTVMDTRPITVEYELTAHGKTLEGVILSIESWGIGHRAHLFSGRH